MGIIVLCWWVGAGVFCKEYRQAKAPKKGLIKGLDCLALLYNDCNFFRSVLVGCAVNLYAFLRVACD